MKRDRRKNPDPIDVKIGANLRAIRQSKFITQKNLGAALGVTFQQVQKYERGTNRISVSRLVQLANVMGVDPCVLLKGISFFDKETPHTIFSLTKEERHILALYRHLKTKRSKKMCVTFLSAFCEDV